MPDAKQAPFTWFSLFAALALAALSCEFLHLQNLPAWSQRGVGLWSAANARDTSQNFLDPYSLTHVLHGVLFYWLLRPWAARCALHWRLLAALTLETGWEVFENSAWLIDRYRSNTAAFNYHGDTILNSLGDVATAVIGFVFASRYSWKASAALFAGFELFMLFLARDNLILNMVMLVYPIEAIKQWQLGG